MAERFDYYMDRCLYHPTEGFYAAGRGVAGRRTGDFITSPEVGPLFGAVIARWLDARWDELGQPANFTVVDAGAGPGTLLRSVEGASPRCAQAWAPVNVDPNGNEFTQPELPESLEGCVVVANELLDNLPFRIVERTLAGWSELFVGEGEEELHPTMYVPSFEIALGRRAPLLERAHQWVHEVQRRGAHSILAFDYGAPTTEELANRGGWLRTYRSHQRGDDPLANPGEWDITTDVAVDQLPLPSNVQTQAEFLGAHGIDELVEEGRAHWQAHAARPDLEAMRMRSRINEATALLEPTGLGSWLAIEWRRT